VNKHKDAHLLDTTLSKTQILKSIEDVCEQVLNMDELVRKMPQQPDSEWNKGMEDALQKLWDSLQVESTVPLSYSLLYIDMIVFSTQHQAC
jgi:hypothetical protein